MIILDSSPLIHLTKIGKMEFLITLYEFIVISPVVYEEVVIKGIIKNYDDAIIIKSLCERNVIQIWTPEPDLALETYLHQGEAQTILLGAKFAGIIIIDEKKGRMVAEQKKIRCISTMDLLLLMLKSKAITPDLFHQNLNRYGADGWISPLILDQYHKEGLKYE